MNISDIALSITISLVSGLAGGVFVTILNHVLERKRRQIEIKNLELKNEKLHKEIMEMDKKVTEVLSNAYEKILYDSSQGFPQYDFKPIVEGRRWNNNKPYGNRGKGTLTFENNGILNIHRTNIDGRLEVHLQQYYYNDDEMEYIPKNELISGNRKIRVRCQAKIVGGEHTLRINIKSTDGSMGKSRDVKVENTEWTQIDIVLEFSPAMDVFLRIDDQDVAKEHSSIQIKNLFVAEKTQK
jgi:hypothetical protein